MKTKKIKVLTVVGTRPEIIRLAAVIKELEKQTEHVLVHTGQNYDYELNEIFFKDLALLKPKYFLAAAGGSAAETIGKILMSIEPILAKEKPDAFLVLGDTNSCLAAYAAKRRQIPVFHMEAGNRCFDQRVPEEINRRIVDQISDINLVYSDLARHNLLRENFPSDRVIKTGSPLSEVLSGHEAEIAASSVLKDLRLKPKTYFVFSAHREENVNNDAALGRLVEIINGVAKEFKMPIIMSVHPRTAARFKARRVKFAARVKLLKPFGLFDYAALQKNSVCVISDSGTIFEESAIFNFPAVALRSAHERPEAMDEAVAVMADLHPERVIQAVNLVRQQKRTEREINCPADYQNNNVSKKVVRIILSYINYVQRIVWFKAV